MDTKHYGASYLIDTGDFLKQLKTQSYAAFSGIKNGTVADLGCGTGMDAANLARILGNNVHVVGVDHDAKLIEHAKSTSEELENLAFIQGEVGELEFEAASLAGVRMERVVQHLRNPDQMFTEVRRVLQDGAPIVIVETIWNSLTFYSSQIETEAKICHYLTTEKVNNGWAGNRLTADLLAHGFQDIRLYSAHMTVRSKDEANRYMFLNSILVEMVEKQKLSAKEMDDFQEALTMTDEAGCFLASMNLVLAEAKK
ncbi:methyltransferase domain-containing protein [Sphingobacterium suaedae]|uniref:Methyltransferase domain-containing protein n=1 Tax=Sphingobacterium suaedae TaxID=1686402 RepID=A0ABW5KFW5_9SPHI